jgi:hypothetical protein
MLSTRTVCLVGLGVGSTWLALRLLRNEKKKRTPAARPHTVRDDSLVALLVDSMVPEDKIREKYPAIAAVVRVMIGMEPNSNAYLEIWPRAFKSFNLIIPNLMNAPFTHLGIGPGWTKGSALQGIGMFAVSRAAKCPYCTAHTCAYALRCATTIYTIFKSLSTNQHRANK